MHRQHQSGCPVVSIEQSSVTGDTSYAERNRVCFSDFLDQTAPFLSLLNYRYDYMRDTICPGTGDVLMYKIISHSVDFGQNTSYRNSRWN